MDCYQGVNENIYIFQNKSDKICFYDQSVIYLHHYLLSSWQKAKKPDSSL